MRAFDVRSGKRLGSSTIPRPGELNRHLGEGFMVLHRKRWSVGADSVDEDLNMAYLPSSSHWRSIWRPPARRRTIRRKHCRRRPQYWKAHLALPVGSPRPVGYGHPLRPNAGGFEFGWKVVKAVAQPTKQAYLYVLDRKTGKPIGPSKKSQSRRAAFQANGIRRPANSQQAACLRPSGCHGR